MASAEEVLYKLGVTQAQAWFGTHLDEAVRLSGGRIPVVIQRCCQMVEDNLECEGLYKVSPVASLDLASRGVHEVCALLKAYLDQLPTPLCSASLYIQFVNAHSIKNIDDRFLRIKLLFGSLPTSNKMVLFHLLKHLHKVAQHSKANKMTVSALATVFCPCIFKCPKEIDSPLRGMTDQPTLAAVLATMISYHHLLLLPAEDTPSLQQTASSLLSTRSAVRPNLEIPQSPNNRPRSNGPTEFPLSPAPSLPPTSPSASLSAMFSPHGRSARPGQSSPTMASAAHDAGMNHVLEGVIEDACNEEFVFSAEFEVIRATTAPRREQDLQAQRQRIEATFGPSRSPSNRLRRLLPHVFGASHPSTATVAEGVSDAAGTATDGSSSGSGSDSEPDMKGSYPLGEQTPALQNHSQPQMQVKRRPHSSRGNEKQLTKELNDDIPVDLDQPYVSVLQRLARRRTRSRRPTNVSDMTKEQMREEKRSIKMELKNFDTLFIAKHRRVPEKKDKEPLREVYALYKSIKHAIEDTHQPTTSVQPPAAATAGPVFVAAPKPSIPQPQVVTAAAPPAAVPLSAANLTDHELHALKQEKRDLKKKLCSYQARFKETFDREVTTKKDREPMAAEYERYRELKSCLKEIDGKD
eukprot:NODE_816_length_2066_cov_73.387545_g776_i0.p1 GENE.NODE_816_length_2066_cov_73.387545_g776_i0~~NODE_816_length_2066_cov_73.387545_g776_i0.p1  ORF type:complete len:656 (+),score=106.72 NODE_816_length_2066_cov_73.387545_g776_i0:61-1968(+)